MSHLLRCQRTPRLLHRRGSRGHEFSRGRVERDCARRLLVGEEGADDRELLRDCGRPPFIPDEPVAVAQHVFWCDLRRVRPAGVTEELLDAGPVRLSLSAVMCPLLICKAFWRILWPAPMKS